MDGVHDMGGMHGFGKVEPEQDEPVFHDDWEARTFALYRAMSYAGVWVIDQARFAREQLPPDVYLASSYYKKWELGMEKQLAELGLAGRDELAAGHALRPGKPLKRKLSAAEVPNIVTRGSFARPSQKPARFKPGDRVRTKNIHPNTHTRLPRYARDKVGVVEALRGCHVFPDTVAIGKGEDPQWLYTVLFDGRELWGESAEPSLKVSIEAFEPYLEPA
ncbi:MAG TPA: nitrile hydratase subunit beta [Xanthobacteraceae bacterium]|jgi:nitrile hydratase beta subunit|nr:nitrile hydratase subunit beta [Xanthobacteraceae bacterium]